MTERGAGLPRWSLSPVEIKAKFSGGFETAADWFGPSAPQAPGAPEDVAGRQWDFPSGYNLAVRTRNFEAISFADLRALADAYDLLRLVIETRKDQIERMNWTIRPRSGQQADAAEIARVEKFFHRPDGAHDWCAWMRMLLEDLFVIDAPALWCERDRAGNLLALHPLDGATIKPVLDAWGRIPRAFTQGGKLVYPVAYQQILKGMPAVNYTESDILYRPRNVRAHRAYGYSPVEQVIATVNIGLKRQLSQLAYYSEGNVPESLIGVPDNWTPDQIKNFQDYWDLYFTGDAAAAGEMRARRRGPHLYPDQRAGAEKRLRRMDRASRLFRLFDLGAALRQPDEPLHQRNAKGNGRRGGVVADPRLAQAPVRPCDPPHARRGKSGIRLDAGTRGRSVAAARQSGGLCLRRHDDAAAGGGNHGRDHPQRSAGRCADGDDRAGGGAAWRECGCGGVSAGDRSCADRKFYLSQSVFRPRDGVSPECEALSSGESKMQHVKKQEAKIISELAQGASSDLNQILIELLKDAPPEKASELKRMIGALMGGILLDILHPLYDEHPNLAPEAMKITRWREAEARMKAEAQGKNGHSR